MKFKHSFNVFIDNFSLTYKQLLYRLIVAVIAVALYIAIITPYVKAVTGSPDYINLVEGVKEPCAGRFRAHRNGDGKD